MTDHFKTIYTQHADQYDALVLAEDVDGTIIATLQTITPLEGKTIIEFGAGTGRVTRLIAPYVGAIHASDLAYAMLKVAKGQNIPGADFTHAANDAMPFPANTADISIEGWSFGHIMGWYGDHWQPAMQASLAEMSRVTQPGGTMILLETLGTGFEMPTPPSAGLATLYHYLEGERGFQHTWSRTDYQFESVDEAEALTRFFFGDKLADRIRREGITRLPECTGYWWKTVEASA